MTNQPVTVPAEVWAELKARTRTLYEMAETTRGAYFIQASAADLYDLLIEAETAAGPIPVAAGQLSLLDWLHDGGAS